MKKASLGELVTITSGYAFKSKLFSDQGEIPLVRIRDVKRGYSDTFFLGDYQPDYIVRNGDLLIGMDGEFNVAKWRGGDALLNQRVCKIQSNSNQLDQGYLYHFLPNELKKIESLTPSVTVKHLSSKRLAEIRIPLPPVEEQKRIAAILDKADAIRRKREKAVELADSFLKSVFLDMFGDPVTNPKGWPEMKLSEISDIKSGVTKGRKFNGKKTSFVPYMRVANVQDGYINLDDISNIEVLENDVDKYKLCIGDLLLTEGGDPDKLGRGAVWEGKINPCIHQNHIFRVRLKKEIILPEYLSVQIGTSRGKRYFLRSAKQTTGVASINMTQLKNYLALVPPMDIQEKFFIIEKKFKSFRRKLLQEKSNSDELFNSLSKSAFRGDL